MKKIIKTLTILSVFATSSMVKADEGSVMDKLKDYGIPCVAGFLGGLLAKNDGAAIGTAVCLGSASVTYLQSQKKADRMREEDFKNFEHMMDSRLKKNEEKEDERVKMAVAELEKSNQAELASVKQVMKEVIAERMTVVEEEAKHEIEVYLQDSAFLKQLEAKTLERIKEEVKLEEKVNRKELIEAVVDEALKQIIEKKVGTPVSQ